MVRRRWAALGAVAALAAGLFVGSLVGGVAIASHQFSDVPDGNPFHDDIAWMNDNNIANGFGDGTYRPGAPVSRQAMAAFMHRLAGEYSVQTSVLNPGSANNFEHEATCSDGGTALAGGGRVQGVVGNVMLTDSYRDPPGKWVARWEVEDNGVADPTSITVFVLCGPPA